MQDHATSSARDHFAWLRTRFSIERTLMAWIRTSTALIAFGFTIVSFFDQFEQMEHVGAARSPHTARILGLGLIGLGTVALVVALAHFRSLSRYLREEPFSAIAGARRTSGQAALTAIAIILFAAGLAAFITVLVRGV
jgi:putative membrane protein